jgi:hypothetical protein
MTGDEFTDIIILNTGNAFHLFETCNAPFKTSTSIHKTKDPIVLSVAVDYPTRDHGADGSP